MHCRNEIAEEREAGRSNQCGDRDHREQARVGEDRAPHRAVYRLHLQPGRDERPHRGGAEHRGARDHGKARMPAEGGADIRAERQAEHRGHRPAHEDESDRAAALLRRHEQCRGRCCLRSEDGRAEGGDHAHHQHRHERGDERRGDVSGDEQQLHRREQRAPVVAARCAREQRRRDAHRKRECGDELPAEHVQ